MVEPGETDVGNPQVRICEIVRTTGSCGFNLTKSKWDPYPWISTVDKESPADTAGVQAGDCLLEVNGEDVLGLRVMEVANRMKAREDRVTVMLWNAGVDPKCTPEALCCGPMPTNLQRLCTCMTAVLAALECPICLDTIPPPAHQCANGHLICVNCRVRTERCPVCRMKFFRGRSLLADQVFNSLIDAFELREHDESQRPRMLKQKLCGNQSQKETKKPQIKVNYLTSPTNKFLTRIMGSGKSSSAENLSRPNGLVSAGSSLSIPTDGEFCSGLRAKSLSTNEIFREETQGLSRTASVLSNRPGSGLLDARLSQRPASYHGSSEDLHSRLISDFGIEFKVTRMSCCPCERTCHKQMPVQQVTKHIQEWHDGPVVWYFKPHLQLELPLQYPKTAVITVAIFNTVFIVKTDQCSLWVWGVSQDKFRFVATVKSGMSSVELERLVLPLSATAWDDITPDGCVALDALDARELKVEIEIMPF